MADPTTLPEGWQSMLDTIGAQIDAAIAAVDARANRLPSPADEPEPTSRRGELAALAARAEALKERLVQAQARADETDRALASAEEFLRWRLAEAESLHQRLAAWAGRAIG